ncbi:MAG: nitroreductase family protein [Lachnospiraceae bacterium]|nr:nitroreductase family protein [Lachnospiraceae bacterium]
MAVESNGSTSEADRSAELVADIPTTQAFLEEPVSDADIQAILTAGINSPSAMNSQP